MVDLPKTNPWWSQQRILDGQDLTPKEQEISDKQFQVLDKTLATLNQPVQKGDLKAAQARVHALKEHFKSLSPQMKQYLYSVLQSNMGRNDLSEIFHEKLSSASRDTLLKILNPDHKTDQIKTETIQDAKAKASKLAEKALEGLSFEQKFRKYVEEEKSDDKW